MKKRLLEASQETPLLGDGAMGTQLMLAGLVQGNCGEAWNTAIRRRYWPFRGAMPKPGRIAF